MLTALRRLLRTAPPAPAPAVMAVTAPMLVTTPEYRLAVRRRAIEAMTEHAEIVGRLAHVEAVRARIQQTKTATDEREAIRSSRFIKEGTKG